MHLVDFYPRPPRGGRPADPDLCYTLVGISIHALREEGDVIIKAVDILKQISIHALREEGDSWSPCLDAPFKISIHALREEGD